MEKQDLELFFNKIKSDKDDFFLRFSSALRAGKNRVYHNVVSQAITLDEGWIDTLENALFSVENIIHNPRRFIIDEELLVDVERAKRITPKTVRHLASNSQFIQSIEPNGDVRPKKLLTTEMNEDLAIYENRFVCTLVHHLVSFVEKRYNELSEKMQVFDQTSVGISSEFDFQGVECKLKLDYSISENPKNQVMLEKTKRTLERVKNLRGRLKILLNTEFIKEVSMKKQVYPPIMKTNLIKMNVDYNTCYKLWLYVSSYQFVGFSVAFENKNLPIENDFYDDLTTVCAMSFQSLFTDNLLNGEEYAAVPFTPLKEKRFRALTAYKFNPSFHADQTEVGEDAINEYYFKALRDELIRATQRSDAVVNEKELEASFSRFFRTVAKINNEMYRDLIEKDAESEEAAKKQTTPIQKRDAALMKQKMLLRRLRLLSSLKRDELEKALKQEAREQIKLEKLQEALDAERGKHKAAVDRRRKQKEQRERILKKAELAKEKAKLYEQELREKDAEQVAAEEERKRQRREAAKRRRELKTLERLKEKYDGTED